MKNKRILTGLVVVILVICIVLISIFTLKPFVLQRFGKKGGFTQEEIQKTDKISKPLYLSMLHVNGNRYYEEASNKKINIDYIIIFNKDGEVIETRVKENGYTTEELKEKNDSMSQLNQPSLNYNNAIKGNTLYYSQSIWNGDSKEEVLSKIKDLENLISEEL